jgi:hypothetical protein
VSSILFFHSLPSFARILSWHRQPTHKKTRNPADKFLNSIGMMFGTLAVCLWRVFVRKQSPWMHRHCRRRGHSCHKANHQAAGTAVVVIEEKSGLMEHQEPPPEYEPAAEEQVADDKA